MHVWNKNRCDVLRRKLIIIAARLEGYSKFCMQQKNKKMLNEMHNIINDIIVEITQQERIKLD